MKRSNRRGISTGTIFMLTLTALVLIAFCALLPKLTGTTDISTNAIDLAVKLDESLAQLMFSAQNSTTVTKPSNTALKPMTTPVPTPTPTPVVEPVKSFSLCAGGAIEMDSATLNTLNDKQDGYRFDILFGGMGGAMQADLTIVTLRNSIVPSNDLSSLNMPEELLATMKQAGIDAVNLGHLTGLNSGIGGLAETKSSITAAGMAPFGLYATAEERSTPMIGSTNGVKIGLVSYLNALASVGEKKTTKEERAYAYAPLDVDLIRSDIEALRMRGAEVVIVSLCWGKANATSPTSQQRETAQQIADAGADIILGTNPQAVFPVEVLTAQRGDNKYHPVLCAYSMGNLFTYNRDSRNNLAGILLKADVQYDPSNGAIAFDNLTYTPTFCWRDTIDSKTRTGMVIADPSAPPSFLGSKQQGVMERCYNLIVELMKDSVLEKNNKEPPRGKQKLPFGGSKNRCRAFAPHLFLIMPAGSCRSSERGSPDPCCPAWWGRYPPDGRLHAGSCRSSRGR